VATIHLSIVTPEGVKFAADVDEFTAPSVQGEFGVLPSHRPLLAGLKTGIVSYRQDGETKAVAIGPGFAKVSDNKANIITDKFIEKDDVDAVIARKDLKEAEEAMDALSQDASEAEKTEKIAASRWAAARLELYGDPPPPTVVLAHEMRLLGGEDYAEEAASSDEEATDSSEEASA
jgi:F-type H+-transporting ATPase subunit epsilon